MLPSLIGLVLRIFYFHFLDLRLVNMYLPYPIHWQGVSTGVPDRKSKSPFFQLIYINNDKVL